jgi:tetratricopeptide (TPR) repeat protein
MKYTFNLGLFLIPYLLNAQTTVKGIVTEQNSGNKPIAGVQIKALGSTPEQTDNAGLFQLVFTSKKPGDRIIVSGIFKKGYEIVNKDVVNNWLIPGNPGDKTKIVMCPEGLIAKNTLKYYDISLDGLTKGYQNRIKELQKERDKAQIDAKTFGEQAKALADQFENQQKQLEELADKFARENFDDCSAIHRQAFEAFKSGNVGEAIRILESVNSENEIAKAKAQKEQGEKMETEGKDWQTQADSIIQQNIRKLMFQVKLYITEFRFEDAEKTIEAIANSDPANYEYTSDYANFLRYQNNHEKSLLMYNKALTLAKTDFELSDALNALAVIQKDIYQYDLAETNYLKSLAIYRKLVVNAPGEHETELVRLLNNLVVLYNSMEQLDKSEAYSKEAIEISRELAKKDTEKHQDDLARSLSTYANSQIRKKQYDKSETNFLEALNIYESMNQTDSMLYRQEISYCLNNLGTMKFEIGKFNEAEVCFLKHQEIINELAKENPVAWKKDQIRALANLASIYVFTKQYDKAENSFLEVIQNCREMAKTNPVVYKPILATALSNMSYMLSQLNQDQKAEASFIKCVDIYRELVTTYPSAFSSDYSSSLWGLGKHYNKLRMYEKAEYYYLEALSIDRGLEKSNPGAYRKYLANLLKSLADLYFVMKQFEKAELHLAEGIDLYEEICKTDPSFIYYTAVRCGTLSYYQIMQKKFFEAEASALKGLKIDTNQEWIKTNLAIALLYQGKYKKARKIYSEHKDKEFPNDKTKKFREIFLQDLDDLEKEGITHPDVAKIRKLLNQ